MSNQIINNDVVAGSIYKIHLKDFIEYKDVVLYPNPYLNIIRGPNGSGKTTFMKAMILGLGGEVKHIVENNTDLKISKYIRPNCAEAIIEIELYQNHGEENLIIKRTIKDSDETEWKINNDIVNEERVQKCLSDLHIKANNRCQILQQNDLSFANMKASQLLRLTLSAVGHDHTIKFLDDLEENEKKRNNIENAIDYISLGHLSPEQEATIKKYYENNKDINHCNQQINLIRYDELTNEISELEKTKTEFESKRKESNKLKAALDEKLKNYEPDKGTKRINKIVENIQGEENKCKTKNKKISVKREALENAKVFCEENLTKGEKEKTLEEYKTELNRKIEELEKSISNEKKKKRSIEEWKNKLMTLKEEEAKHLKEFNDFLYSKNEERINILKKDTKYKDTLEAIELLRRDPNFTSIKYYKPMMLELKFTNAEFSKYLEAVVDERHLTAFTFTCEEHLRAFRDATSRAGLRAHAVLPRGPAGPPGPPAPPGPPVQLAGFISYLSKLIQTEDPIMKFLCETYRIHEIPVSYETTSENDDVSNVHCYFTKNHKVMVKSGVRVLSAVRPAVLLADTSDIDARNTLLANYENARAMKVSKENAQPYSNIDDNLGPLKKELEKFKTIRDNLNLKNLKKEETELKNIILYQLDQQRELHNNFTELHKHKILKIKLEVQKNYSTDINQRVDAIEKLIQKKNRELTNKKKGQMGAAPPPPGNPSPSPAALLERRRELEQRRRELELELESLNVDNNLRENFTKKMDLNSEKEKCEKNIEKLMRECKTSEIEDLISNINNDFSDLMKRVAISGEIKFKSEVRHRTTKYGIYLEAQFRKNVQKMILLFDQSQGEQMLSTACFLLALRRQDLAPFRCLDEINQGMDATNEIKTINLLSESAQKDKCQYFYVTPSKLPPNLKLDNLNNVMIHTIMKGGIYITKDNWDYNRFLDRARRNKGVKLYWPRSKQKRHYL